MNPNVYELPQNLALYDKLQEALRLIRVFYRGQASAEEDHILEMMDAVWNRLTDEECAFLDSDQPLFVDVVVVEGATHPPRYQI